MYKISVTAITDWDKHFYTLTFTRSKVEDNRLTRPGEPSFPVTQKPKEWPNQQNHLVKRKECTNQHNTKRPEQPKKTTKVGDHRILSLVKKNPVITSDQVKNTLKEVNGSLSKTKITRCLHECKHRGLTAGANNSRTLSAKFWKIQIFGQMKARLILSE